MRLAGGLNVGSVVLVKEGVLSVGALGCSGSGAKNEETSVVRWDISFRGGEWVQDGTMVTSHLLSCC